MPLSTVLGAQSVIKPGVCTTATRPSSPYTGQLIYDTTLSQTLAYNGSAWVNVGATAGGLVLISATTVGTTVSSVTVSNAFSTTYDNYKIVYTGGISTAWTTLRLQIGASTTGYYVGRTTVSYAGVSGPAGLVNGTEFIYIGTAAPNTNSANIDVQSPNLAKRTVVTAQDAAAVTTGEATFTSGFLNDDTQHTSFRLFVSGQTLTGGTIYLYGYAKA